MELNLIVPVPKGAARQRGDEKLNGKWWRVNGPIDSAEWASTKFHCVSYVWGHGISQAGSFFHCKRVISDRTRPALEAAIKAAEGMHRIDGGEKIQAFWIDAICVPQDEEAEASSRQATLESMGFIYSTACSVIVIFQEAAWSIIKKASMSNTATQLSPQEMKDLELDTWVSRVWTYQEMVNNSNVYFTTFFVPEDDQQIVVPHQVLLNCVGYSMERWKRERTSSQAETLLDFPNLNNLEDTLADVQLAGYLQRSALGVLSNMAARKFDPSYPGNRLLASLGALTQKASWSPAATLPELSEKLLAVCEEVNDYSFIYTKDQRDATPGLRWRPDPHQAESSDRNNKPLHLLPVLNWSSYGEPLGNTQRAHRDSRGIWLENMIRLERSESMNANAVQRLEAWLYGQEHDPTNPNPEQSSPSVGFFGGKERGKLELIPALFKAFEMIGFTGSSSEAQVCESGLFFPVMSLEGRQDVEMFAAGSVRWTFGAPGLARWREGDVTMYTAGVFAGDNGLVMGNFAVGESLLMT